MFNLNLEPPDKTPLQLLDDEIQQLKNQIEQTSTSLAPCRNSIKVGQAHYEERWEAFQQEMETLKANIKAQQEQLNELLALIDQYNRDLQELQLRRAELLKEQAEKNKLQDLEKELLALTENLRDTIEKLRAYQWTAIVEMVAAYNDGESGFLLADDRGLGKTLDTIVLDAILIQLFLKKHGRLPNCLWLTKKTLRGSALDEFKLWNPERQVIHPVGTKEQQAMMIDIAIQNNFLLVTNYESLNAHDTLRNFQWDFVYIDEVHKLKGGSNPTPTKVWENTRDVCQRAEFSVFLSGTPIQNHPKEMWAYLHIFDPLEFPSVREFEARYCYGWGEGWTVDWDRMIKALAKNVIRRSKEDVGIELPPKVYSKRHVEMTDAQMKLYMQLRDNFFIWLDEQEGKALTATAIIAQITRLRQLVLCPSGIKIQHADGTTDQLELTESGKIDEAMELIEELYLEGEQVVVWSSQFNEPLFELKRRLDRWGMFRTEVLHGGNSDSSRVLERAFQEGKIHVLCINSRSGAEGLNLQKFPGRWEGGASNAIFLDRWWNPAINEQCEDRIYREGQSDTAMIHIFHCDESVDDFVLNICETKQNMIEGIMEDRSLRGNDWKTILEDLI